MLNYRAKASRIGIQNFCSDLTLPIPSIRQRSFRSFFFFSLVDRRSSARLRKRNRVAIRRGVANKSATHSVVPADAWFHGIAMRDCNAVARLCARARTLALKRASTRVGNSPDALCIYCFTYLVGNYFCQRNDFQTTRYLRNAIGLIYRFSDVFLGPVCRYRCTCPAVCPSVALLVCLCLVTSKLRWRTIPLATALPILAKATLKRESFLSKTKGCVFQRILYSIFALLFSKLYSNWNTPDEVLGILELGWID